MLSPADLGAPRRYDSWRPGQDDSLARLMAVDAERDWQEGQPPHVSVLNLPTGSGKTLIGVTFGQMLEGPRLYVTSSRGLQGSVHVDMAELGIHNVMGMGNHECVEHGGMCDEAPCLDGQFCALRDGGCLYYDSVRKGAVSDWVVTNYAWWLSSSSGGGVGARPYIVLDEAHAAHEHLAGYVKTSLDPSSIPPFLRPGRGWETWDMPRWSSWARAHLDEVKSARAESMTRSMRHKFRVLGTALTRLAEATGRWFIEMDKRTGHVSFEPLWPHEYAGPLLFRGAQRVLMMSATIRPRELRYLGLKESEVDFIESTNPTPAWRRPFFHVPVAKLSSKSPREVWRLLVERMDKVIADRLHWRGIIHVPSYELGEMIVSRSAFRHLMIAPQHTGHTKAAVESFRQSTPGGPASIIVSPALGTGWDFPGDQARYQLIPKLSAPVPTALMLAREAEDPGYGWYRTAQDTEQKYGRSNRGPEDYSETFCFDDHILWMKRAHREWFTPGFHDAFRRLPVASYPKPYSL